MTQDLPGIKPCSKGVRTWMSSGSKCFGTQRSNNLLIMDRREISRKLGTKVLIPFLNTGVMLACFQSSGSRPKRIDLLKSTHKEAASSCAHYLRILGCNPSGQVFCLYSNTAELM